MGFQLSKDEINNIVSVIPKSVEGFLITLKYKLSEYKKKKEMKNNEKNNVNNNNNNVNNKNKYSPRNEYKSNSPRRLDVEALKEVDLEILTDKEIELQEYKEANEVFLYNK